MKISAKNKKKLNDIKGKRWKDVTDDENLFIKETVCIHCTHFRKYEGGRKGMLNTWHCDYIGDTMIYRGCKPGLECIELKRFEEKKEK